MGVSSYQSILDTYSQNIIGKALLTNRTIILEINQTEMSKFSKISINEIKRIECSERIITTDHLKKLLDVSGVSIESFGRFCGCLKEMGL